MKSIIAFAAILAAARASVLAPLAAISVPAYSQFHAQDDLGQYTYGYSDHLSAKAESRSLDGSTAGSYSYVDPEGKIQSVEYTSDAVHGFRVAASNLPVAPSVPEVPALVQPSPVQDTAEVAEARAKHLAALEEARVGISMRSGINGVPTESAPAPALMQPTPVQDTAEVVEARAKHLAALEEARLRAIQVDAIPTVVSNSVEAKSAAAPALIAPAIATAALAPVQPLAFRSGFITPNIAYRTAPVSAFGYSYNVNGLYGYNPLYSYPGIATYSVPFASQVFTSAPIIAPAQEDNRGEKKEQ